MGRMSSGVRKRFIWAGVLIVAILVIGTFGYWLVGERQYSFLDALYMTVITIATIGYREVIDVAHSPAGKVFTKIIALSGIGIYSYELHRPHGGRRADEVLQEEKNGKDDRELSKSLYCVWYR